MKEIDPILSKLSYEVLDRLPVPVFWFDETARFIEVNQRACAEWGYTKEEFLEMSIWDVNPKMSPNTWKQHWETKIKDPSSFESVHRRKDGTLFPVDIIDNFVAYNNKIVCCAIIRDVSERKESNRVARLSRFTIESAGDAIFWINKEGVIVDANAKALKAYGYSEEELIGMSVLKISQDMSTEVFEEVWEKIKTEKTTVLEGIHYTKAGKKINVEINANFFQFEDQEYSASIVRDVTVRKGKEAALRGALMEIRELKEKLEIENNYLNEEIEVKNDFGEIITNSDEFRKVLKQVEQVANTDSTVLITGESGTEKELLVRAIHQLSVRSTRPVIKVSLGSLPHHMIESELLGHEKGAFVGALSRKIGKFELANEGTLYLEEIDEVPLEMQANLLRIIRDGQFERLGGLDIIKVNVRIIATSSKDLAEETQAGRFLEELYYYLNVFPIQTIPLRDRKEDIPILTRYFCERIGSRINKKITDIPQSAITKLTSYDFPGNVRELENLIERGVITSRAGKLNLSDFNLKQKRTKPSNFLTLEEMQRQHIAKVLQKTDWRVSGDKGASVILGIPPTTLFSKIKKLGIKRSTKVEFD